MPISLRPPPAQLEDLQLQNMISLGIVEYPLSTDLSETIKKGKAATAHRFKPSVVYASQKMQLIFKYIHEVLSRFMINLVVTKNNIILSNVPGPKKQIKFMDANVIDILPVTPNVWSSAISILG